MQSSDNEILWQKYPQVTWNEIFDATVNVSLASNQPLSYNSASGGSVNHKDWVSGKPIRRRSRASKKTPVKLLNANLSNFRALVQQFTGCQSTPSTCYKGPVTLNFQRRSSRRCDAHRISPKERSEQSLVSFGTNYINNINACAVSSVAVTEYAPSEGDSLTLDNFNMENFSLREPCGPGDYSTSTWGQTVARNDDSWSYSN
ncbi:hypothetical protein F511_33792 [Dorcoceras hygrometricum]|uniref:VQ domain-containing protein n=1 Tax=Dorcoceras hygrometricum TaxID=472368 RepID=A0A2Z7ASI5_9LAMI|nr:hypothetical protein F511_33792 [Dorcoceras hygrometricum]